jgi:two-component system response regulator AlgR
MTPLRVLVVDDEPLARRRLRAQLAQLAPRLPNEVVGEAGDGPSLLALLRKVGCDLVLLDISLPGENGLILARRLREAAATTEVIFVTAHDEHALAAFELDARDYLLKPVRVERLLEALGRVQARRVEPSATKPQAYPSEAVAPEAQFLVHQRGTVRLIPVHAIRYLRAEQKYLHLDTAEGPSLLEGSLAQIERDHAALFLRIHRNCLVRRSAITALERSVDAAGEARWWLVLRDVPERLQVSRRQLAAVREFVESAGN